MARSALMGNLQRAVAHVAEEQGARTTRAGLLRTAGVAGMAAVGLGRLAPTARAAAPATIVVVGAGLAGLTCAYRLKQAGYVAQVHEASERVGGRCWTGRGFFNQGQLYEHGGELIDQGHQAIRQLAQQLGLNLDNLLSGEVNGTEPLYYFDGHPYTFAEATDDLKHIWQKLHMDVSAASYPTLFDNFTERGYELDHLSIVEWIEESVPGGIGSKLGQLLDIAYNIEYGAESSVQSSLNLLYLLGYVGPGQFRTFGKSNEKYHVRGGNDQIPARLAVLLAGQITTGSELVAVKRTPAGAYTLTFRQGSGTATITADKVVLALPFSIIRRSVNVSKADFSARKLQAIAEQGMGTNSKLHVQFNRPPLERPRLQRGHRLRHRVPEHVGGLAHPARHRRHPGRLHGRKRRCQLRLRNPVQPCAAVPFPDRASASRALATLEREGDDRLLAGVRVDTRLVLVLEGRPVHRVRGDRGPPGRERPLLRRAYVDRLPGLLERRG